MLMEMADELLVPQDDFDKVVWRVESADSLVSPYFTGVPLRSEL
jgi:hypothetical protein